MALHALVMPMVLLDVSVRVSQFNGSHFNQLSTPLLRMLIPIAFAEYATSSLS